MKKPFLFLIITVLCACGGPFDINRSGGVVYTVKVDVTSFLQRESNHSGNPFFRQALLQTDHQLEAPAFIGAFVKKFAELSGGQNLAALFMAAHSEKYQPAMSSDGLVKKLEDEYRAAVERTAHILSNRLERYGVGDNQKKVYSNPRGHIIVELAAEFAGKRAEKLLKSGGEMAFYETWENSEVYEYFDRLNATLAADSVYYSTADTTFNRMPLFRYMRPAVRYEGLSQNRHMSFIPGSMVGMTLVGDTGRVNSLLHSPAARVILPHNLVWIWGLNTEATAQQPPSLGLYAIKARSVYDPVLSGSYITDAHHARDKQTGHVIVNITMNGEGADIWARVTEANKGRSIAIVFDNHVYSAPVVYDKIPNGSSVISGNFTEDEAADLANLLQSGTLPMRTGIIEKKTVKGR